MKVIRVLPVAALVLLVAACGLDPGAVALAESACQTLEQVQDEPFDPTQLAAYNDWFNAKQSDMNTVAVGGGSADYEAALRGSADLWSRPSRWSTRTTRARRSGSRRPVLDGTHEKPDPDSPRIPRRMR